MFWNETLFTRWPGSGLSYNSFPTVTRTTRVTSTQGLTVVMRTVLTWWLPAVLGTPHLENLWPGRSWFSGRRTAGSGGSPTLTQEPEASRWDDPSLAIPCFPRFSASSYSRSVWKGLLHTFPTAAYLLLAFSKIENRYCLKRGHPPCPAQFWAVLPVLGAPYTPNTGRAPCTRAHTSAGPRPTNAGLQKTLDLANLQVEHFQLLCRFQTLFN